MNPNKSVLVPVADGCEEIETVAILNILRRAGIEVSFVSIKPITGDLPVVVGRSESIHLRLLFDRRDS